MYMQVGYGGAFLDDGDSEVKIEAIEDLNITEVLAESRRNLALPSGSEKL